jgi:hypothetical protein
VGGYQKVSEARVFENWKVEAFETPKDAHFLFGADWGFARDPTVLVRCFVVDSFVSINPLAPDPRAAAAQQHRAQMGDDPRLVLGRTAGRPRRRARGFVIRPRPHRSRTVLVHDHPPVMSIADSSAGESGVSGSI